MRNAFFLLFPVFLFFSCSEKENNEEYRIFKYNESVNILTLDPVYAKDLPHIWACNQLYNTLLAFDDDMNLVPSLAKRWYISDDGKTYTFVLRDDVFFHNDSCFGGKSRNVVADDVVFSFNRVVDRKLSSPGVWIFSAVHQDENGYSFKALNDSVFVVELERPFPAFTAYFKIRRYPDGRWEVMVDKTGSGTYHLETQGVDNSFLPVGYFGLVATYTASNAKKFFFDDLYIGEPVMDTEPPALVSANVIDNYNVSLAFNECLDASSSLDVTNYLVSDFGYPDSVILCEDEIIKIVKMVKPTVKNVIFVA